jgi:hypothetical protein
MPVYSSQRHTNPGGHQQRNSGRLSSGPEHALLRGAHVLAYLWSNTKEPENSRARYLTVEEQTSLFAVLKDDLGFLNATITVSLGTGMRKGIELLKLKVGHLNFSSRPVFYAVRG